MTQPLSTVTVEELKALDIVAVINIFNALGIAIKSHSFEVERLKPKRSQHGPDPILLKLISPKKRKPDRSANYCLLKNAKKLKELNEFKHIAISQDLIIEQR